MGDERDYDAQYRQYIREGWKPVLDTRAYACGMCGRSVSSHVGLRRHESIQHSANMMDVTEKTMEIRACPHCWAATTFGPKDQYPKPLLGQEFRTREKPEDVKQVVALYNEAREALSQGAPSCAVLMFRKILMHIAVQQGAKPNLRFIQYVDYLKDEAVVGKPMHGLVDRIRTGGNEENHDIVRATPEAAQDLLKLVTLLIHSVYFAE